MASIRVSKRKRKASTGHHKQTLSDKETEYNRRPSISVKNRRSTIEKKTTTAGKVTNSSKKRSSEKKSTKNMSYFNENSVVENSKRSKKSTISCQKLDSLSVTTRKSSIERLGKNFFDYAKTPICSKSVSKGGVRKSVEGLQNCNLNNIAINYKNKQNSDINRASIKCTRSSAHGLSFESLKKPSINIVNASEIQISTKPTKKSIEFTPKIGVRKSSRLSKEVKEISANSKKKSVDNSFKQKSAKCVKSVSNQKQDNIKDGSLTRSASRNSADTNYISKSQRLSTRLTQKMSNNREITQKKDAQLSLASTASKKTSSCSNKTENNFSKNRTSSESGKKSLQPLCVIQQSFLKGKRTSLSPLGKIDGNQKMVSPLHTESSSATTASKKKFQNKLSKKSSGSCKYSRKDKSIDLSSIPPDDLLPKQSGTKRKLESAGSKMPGKNTLKYKRMTIEAVKQADVGYEDDLFESKNFDKFQELLFSPTASESFLLMSTPKFGIDLTPVVRKKTPVFKDCFNPEALAKRRKIAEEYFYRINKNRKSNQKRDTPTPVVPEKKKLEFSKVIEKVSKIQEEINKQSSKDDEEDEGDSYFSFLESTPK